VKIDEGQESLGDAVRVDPFINEVYEAAILPDKWQGVLDGLAEMAEAEGTLLFAADPGVPRWISSNAIQATTPFERTSSRCSQRREYNDRQSL
jgi:hypothetical protein